ncbi:hypothetical protein CLAFUW4_11193 [Fulvia fulva]|nr:hypothetical protein CLAFUR4_11198 [Fulvia fulva]KAK4620700.1 hypothetical protein CLAFUR0_11203 [Fulvia fulva]WPV16988.1 hypothetical protein CLAFUW4_11193 [Fulvia fulva]WPV31945.1 hypothetical protein CLAFUW7_11189 [Fulvia fulva]
MTFTIMPSFLHKLFTKRRQKRTEHKSAKLASRDKERQTDGLLRIAMKRHNSVNSFTAADPSVHYRRREDHEQWAKHEAGGNRANYSLDQGRELKG